MRENIHKYVAKASIPGKQKRSLSCRGKALFSYGLIAALLFLPQAVWADIPEGDIANGVQGAIAIGNDSYANADYSITIGDKSVVDGEFSIALGSNSKATAVNSIALGYYSEASAQHSIALGDYSVADEENTVSVGGMAQHAVS